MVKKDTPEVEWPTLELAQIDIVQCAQSNLAKFEINFSNVYPRFTRFKKRHLIPMFIGTPCI